MQHISSPAKLTVSLRVTGVRDDGFHLIDAEMIALDFGDELTIDPEGASKDLLVLDEDGSPIFGVPLDESNLVRRALALANREAAVTITKRIPPGAGLGGGSANAAAVLRWAGFDDLGAASRIGADIAFCIVGGRARVKGIGELVTPLPFEEAALTLLTPPFGCNTAAVYRAWDDLGGPTGDNGNDLEAAALVVEPRLARWRDTLGELSGTTPRLAGSGSTWFVPGTFESEHTVTAQAIPRTMRA